VSSYLDTPKGQADLLRERASELNKLADQLEAGHAPSPRDLERHLEFVNAEAAKAMNAFYEHDRQTTRLRQAEANLSRAVAMMKGAENRKARQIKTTRGLLEEFNKWNLENERARS
jgi:hypothetical protein